MLSLSVIVGVFSASLPPPVLHGDGVMWWAWSGDGGVLVLVECAGGRKLT